MVATIYGSSQAQLSERLGNVMRCDARFTADIKKPRISEADIALLLMVNLRVGCHGQAPGRTLWNSYFTVSMVEPCEFIT
ncbi:hypothetical protein FZI44_16910 [Cronobacter sakazakii]|nr:hypothetical protein FZI15_00330 [Cronobacter sakazakii]KAB0821793.1 hypothetical protein FZI44_16910 [Cronobacter sakazakii]